MQELVEALKVQEKQMELGLGKVRAALAALDDDAPAEPERKLKLPDMPKPALPRGRRKVADRAQNAVAPKATKPRPKPTPAEKVTPELKDKVFEALKSLGSTRLERDIRTKVGAKHRLTKVLNALFDQGSIRKQGRGTKTVWSVL